ncbi:probable LRR receptor-like serine/threonine-protein kinase At1g67720 isoform X2 [Papaver somniferum]|uniref:probable LRR receptor-like serine/threonine-protein kinase At1g67720 isoform X2 n=1 Tax=Papaver somniferum TaxID=3469 RepID=UPI000E6F8132|nr:probable LRR receptor-like serine/threonine-protein kinase At1g67720 isoform X2 [Papaver somniferum]
MNLVHFISVLSISSLIILSASAQTRKTKSTDVEALRVLEASFGIISLSSDPCLPEPYSWIKCSSDDTPRITTIDLHDENIYGVTLPDFSSMDALEIMNLAGNFFYGTIPTSLENNKNVIVTLTGTQQGFLCYSDKELRNRNRDRNFTRNIDS